jgi:predicted DsbA family dithiol-disulfide isomerase
VKPTLEVVEFTDPACPWAWGSEPKFRRLRQVLGAGARFGRVFGILFDTDDDQPPDPAAEASWYRRHLAEISAHTAAPAPADLRWVTQTSWPASLAATAARAQGDLVAERVLRRLRESTFVLGTPADTDERVLAAVRGVPGLDLDRLAGDLTAAQVRATVRRDWSLARSPCPEVLAEDGAGPHNGRAKPTQDGYRYALPTLLLTGPAGRVVVPGWRSLDEYLRAAEQVAPGIEFALGYADADEALDRHRSLSGPELRMLTGADRIPSGAVPVPTGNGPLWLHPAEAAVHPALR